MQAYADRLKAGIELEAPIAQGVLKLKAGLGELMPREKGGRGKKLSQQLGDFNPNTVTAYRKLADNRARMEEYFEQCDDMPGQTDFIQWCKGTHVSRNSGNNEWYTPPQIIEAARKAMGTIELDPASSKVANKTVRAKKFFCAVDKGQSKTWKGNVWLNPPYSQPLVSEFCNAVVEAYTSKSIPAACVLTNNATETEWGQLLMSNASAVCFLTGRVKYLDETGEPANTPLQGQCVCYFGTKPAVFRDAFMGLGKMLKPYS